MVTCFFEVFCPLPIFTAGFDVEFAPLLPSSSSSLHLHFTPFFFVATSKFSLWRHKPIASQSPTLFLVLFKTGAAACVWHIYVCVYIDKKYESVRCGGYKQTNKQKEGLITNLARTDNEKCRLCVQVQTQTLKGMISNDWEQGRGRGRRGEMKAAERGAGGSEDDESTLVSSCFQLSVFTHVVLIQMSAYSSH